jgi:hypothetical protein
MINSTIMLLVNCGRTNLNDEDLGTAKTITFLTNSLIIIWRDISPTLRGTSCLWSLQKSGAHKILAGSSPTLTQYVPTLEKNVD